MTVKTSQVKRGSIRLSSQLQKSWEGADVYIMAEVDSLIIKKMENPSLSALKSRLKSIGAQISENEIEEEIEAVRSR
ncbi:MAG: hypothetical protein G01um101418_63 [Parcubacteria group bacterium Gr01-1014_18]|nr:MAG: hypothetical protein Greene041636_63 [Parcubacteria group bacterium Greene0416_36]TSC81569.1 MAG: hypothetical protein G01um101418_63 [Parcubacteria group bacterium Gr01-1014_18]TSC99620.1 MAG: hypothetical protein Greene101420_24 [Parcubacteria group bacterium Greene1014_20]TSD07071.1 MAG: hypothetical protein Greene07142_383 [Parcubacteria group bacterium Greene0714_2]